MQTLPFDPSRIEYAKRIEREKSPAPSSALSVTLIGLSGALHDFNLYTFAPFFESQPRHLFSRCGRVIVMRQRVFLNSDDEKPVTMPDQFHVFYKSNRVPELRYTLRTMRKPKQYRAPARHKQSCGRDDTLSNALRETARQQYL